MQALDRIATAVVLFLGVGHVAATPRFAPGFSEGAAWFSGSGLALVLVAFLNLCRLAPGGASPRQARLCVIANALSLAWIGLVTATVPLPQAFVVAGAVLVVTIGSLVNPRVRAKAVA